MNYLETVKNLEKELFGGEEPVERRGATSEGGSVTPVGGSDAASEHLANSEKCEFSERRSAPPNLPIPGCRNNRRRSVLTIEDLPELERTLRLLGWHVVRRGNELHCTP